VLKEGGPNRVKRVGTDEYEMRIPVPPDLEGMIGRECPDKSCSPGYFKMQITADTPKDQFCPYCRYEGPASDFASSGQIDYATAVVGDEVIEGAFRYLSHALGVGPSGHRRFGSGAVSVEVSVPPPPRRPLRRPLEEELCRLIRCPVCGSEHKVFGLATWCPSCGNDVLLEHVHEELGVIERVLGALETRRTALGARVAARDVENGLEDLVSTFEAVLKHVTRRFLAGKGLTKEQVEDILSRRVRNSYQSIRQAREIFLSICEFELFEGLQPGAAEDLAAVFEKRHPITHNLGVIDRKYMDRAKSFASEGREILVTEIEVRQAMDVCEQVLGRAYRGVAITGPNAPRTIEKGEI
jgi:hypothetical protein